MYFVKLFESASQELKLVDGLAGLSWILECTWIFSSSFICSNPKPLKVSVLLNIVKVEYAASYYLYFSLFFCEELKVEYVL
jgi:hypothetical protein